MQDTRRTRNTFTWFTAYRVAAATDGFVRLRRYTRCPEHARRWHLYRLRYVVTTQLRFAPFARRRVAVILQHSDM